MTSHKLDIGLKLRGRDPFAQQGSDELPALMLALRRAVGWIPGRQKSYACPALPLSVTNQAPMKILFRPARGLVAVAPALLALMLAPAAQGASFNCKKAKNAVEQQVCKDKTLSRKDDTVEQLYQQTLKGLKGDAAKQAKKNQESWLELRDACTSFECLDYQYAKRIYELK
jgi:uncharacterized protein YecT (DUF1311 family)